MKVDNSSCKFKLTSDNDRAGLTQSSQHFPRRVNKTSAGEIPSHCVLNCSCRLFSWQNISVRNAMKAVKRGRDGFLEMCMALRTLSRSVRSSWYHWRQVFSRASKKVSFCSFEIIEMHNREIGSEYLREGNRKRECALKCADRFASLIIALYLLPSTARFMQCVANSIRQRAVNWLGSSDALLITAITSSKRVQVKEVRLFHFFSTYFRVENFRCLQGWDRDPAQRYPSWEQHQLTSSIWISAKAATGSSRSHCCRCC